MEEHEAGAYTGGRFHSDFPCEILEVTFHSDYTNDNDCNNRQGDHDSTKKDEGRNSDDGANNDDNNANSNDFGGLLLQPWLRHFVEQVADKKCSVERLTIQAEPRGLEEANSVAGRWSSLHPVHPGGGGAPVGHAVLRRRCCSSRAVATITNHAFASGFPCPVRSEKLNFQRTEGGEGRRVRQAGISDVAMPAIAHWRRETGRRRCLAGGRKRLQTRNAPLDSQNFNGGDH
uniref:Uncharacterized protein n=1 Tax=Oryza glumipatula TaxID=40148 RepID=A0A0E0BL91_9ORYZ